MFGNPSLIEINGNPSLTTPVRAPLGNTPALRVTLTISFIRVQEGRTGLIVVDVPFKWHSARTLNKRTRFDRLSGRSVTSPMFRLRGVQNTQLLSQFLSDTTGQILRRDVTGLCAKHQRKLASDMPPQPARILILILILFPLLLSDGRQDSPDSPCVLSGYVAHDVVCDAQ
jgi:ribosomal protein S18